MARRHKKGISKKKFRKYVVGKGFLSKVNDFLKKTKIISNVAGMIPGIGGTVAKGIAGTLGYGRRRRRTKRRGGSILNKIKGMKGSMPERVKVGGPDTIPDFLKNQKVENKGPKYSKIGHPFIYKKGTGRRRHHKKSRSGSNLDNRYIDNKIRVL